MTLRSLVRLCSLTHCSLSIYDVLLFTAVTLWYGYALSLTTLSRYMMFYCFPL